jgi:hypothetical protein
MTPASQGYAATRRIERVQPRFTAWQGRQRIDDGARAGQLERDDATPVAELDGEPFDDWIGDRLAALRDAFSQTTFFLTDPNSWR